MKKNFTFIIPLLLTFPFTSNIVEDFSGKFIVEKPSGKLPSISSAKVSATQNEDFSPAGFSFLASCQAGNPAHSMLLQLHIMNRCKMFYFVKLVK